MQEIRVFGRFIAAAFSEWRLLMTGLCLALLFGAYEHFKQASFSWKAYCAILFFTLFASVYLAWRREYINRVELEDKKRPALKMKIDSLAIATYRPTGDAIITIVATIINHGADSTFSLGDAKLTFPGGQEAVVQKMAADAEDIKLPGSPGTPTMLLAYEDRLSRKSIGQPVVRNGGTYGWLMFIAQGYTQEQVSVPGVEFDFHCFDVNQTVFSARKVIGIGPSKTFIPRV